MLKLFTESTVLTILIVGTARIMTIFSVRTQNISPSKDILITALAMILLTITIVTIASFVKVPVQRNNRRTKIHQ
jgi:hypothetical protein